MEYKQALERAWKEITNLSRENDLVARFLGEEYTVDLSKRNILSSSRKVSTKDHVSIIILHYLIQKLKAKTMFQPKGEWLDFRQLVGGEGYYPAFKKRTIDVILNKYEKEPDMLLEALKRLNGKPAATGDIGIVIDAFEGVPILITIWRGDEEFQPEANILFDETISTIFCTEDIVVLTEVVVHSL